MSHHEVEPYFALFGFLFLALVCVVNIWLVRRDQKKLSEGKKENTIVLPMLGKRIPFRGMSDDRKLETSMIWLVFSEVGFLAGALAALLYIIFL